MSKSDTLNLLNLYNQIIDKSYPNSCDRDFIKYFILNFAKNIIQEFGEADAKKLAKIILDFVE